MGFFFFLVVGLEFELRTLSLLRRYSTTSATSPTLFDLVIFRIGSHGFAWAQPGTKILLPTASI
jgi:hypothetical protein